MQMYQVSKAVDYMQFTSLHPVVNKDRTFELKPSFMQNYKVMRVLPSGMTCHHGHNNSDKWLNVATGDVCSAIPNQREYVQNVLSDGATFSRIDYQVTVADGITVDMFRQWCIDGKVTGTLSEIAIKSIVNDIQNHNETTYIGDMKKRGKHGIFRCYDKGLELGLESQILTRFELEERKKRAQITAKRYADGMEIGDIIRQRVDVDDPLWIETIGAKSESLTRYPTEKKKDDIDSTWKWLVETCAKTLGEKCASDEWLGNGEGNFNLFIAEMNKSYEKQKQAIIDSIRTDER